MRLAWNSLSRGGISFLPFMGGRGPMGWGAEQSAFAVTGALLLLCTAIASNPRWGIGRTWLVVTIVGSFSFIVTAFLLKPDDGMTPSIWAWLSAVGPAILLLVWTLRVVAIAHPRYHALDWVVPGRARQRREGTGTAADLAAASVRLARAGDPATPAAELADLAYSHPDARAAVAANPSTPASVLGWLAATGDDDVIAAIAQRTSSTTPSTDEGDSQAQ